jgi:hypothetical protein
VGIGDNYLSSDPVERRCTLATMVASGVQLVRSMFYWAAIEPARRQFDFAFYDHYVGELARYRIRVLPLLFGTPRFYSAAPSARYPERAQPRRPRDLARFARALARRYGGRGSFWRQNPRLPRVPIRSWQIWNEENLSFFWTPRPSARQYVHMLAAASRAIRSADRRAEIVVGGLPNSRFGPPIATYLQGLYRAGAKRWFDTVALHTYSRSTAAGLGTVARIRRLMDRNGDRKARIWVTEFGWSSGGPRHPFRVSRAAQAVRIAATLRELWRRRARLGVRGAIHVMWRDAPAYTRDFWGLHLGLYARNGKPKPAAAAFRRSALSLR